MPGASSSSSWGSLTVSSSSPAQRRADGRDGSASEASEILLSAETAALLEGDALAEKGGGRLLRAAPGARGTVALPSVEGIPLR
jgi:hypothetical protein